MERLSLEKLVEESIAQWYCSEGTPGRSQLWMGLVGCPEIRGDSQGGSRCHSLSLFGGLQPPFHLLHLGAGSQILISDCQGRVPSGF